MGKVAAHFEPVVNAHGRLVAPPPTRRTPIGGYPKVVSYDMLGKQLHYSNPGKHGFDQEVVQMKWRQEWILLFGRQTKF